MNSKVVFLSKDGKIQQKKILTDTKDGEVVFEEGYSLTFFDSPLGKLMRFKTEGEKFGFGKIKLMDSKDQNFRFYFAFRCFV